MDFLAIALGLGSATAAAIAARRIALGLGRSPAAAFALSAFILAGLIYVGTLQGLILYGLPDGDMAADLAPETMLLGYAALAALISIAAGVGLVAAWLTIRGQEAAPNRFKTFGLATLFSLAVCILAAPLLIQNQLAIGRAISANEAEINAFTQSYKSGLERLAKIGALSRIEVDDAAVVHYIGGPLYEVGADGLAKYARAAMVYQTLVLGETAKPIVLRDAATEDPIGTFRTDGVFVLQTKRNLTQARTNR
jgi:hypothetical protein